MFKNCSILTLIFVISGCSSISTIDNNEAFKYEKKYFSEYVTIKNTYVNQNIIKWIQAANKSEPCKLFVSFSGTDDPTLDENFEMFWDGTCKDGYAIGLGREFAKGTVLNSEALAIYQGKKQKPSYYIMQNNLANQVLEGDLNNGYFVITTIADDNFNLKIDYQYGYFSTSADPALLINSSPFFDSELYSKFYPNFSYTIFMAGKDEFDYREFEFDMNYHQQKNGFGMMMTKDKKIIGTEKNNGEITRNVNLPYEYYQMIGSISYQIYLAGQKAIEAQKYALQVKKQYLTKTCKDSVLVDFMDNNEYKNICSKSDYLVELQEKIDKKLSQISQSKQQKREQKIQQNLLNSQIIQTNTIQRQANATEKANSIQVIQNTILNQQAQQLQQLNTNLMFMRMGI